MSRGTLDPALLTRLSLTGLSPSLAGFPKTILLNLSDQLRGPNPGMHAFRGYGLHLRFFEANRTVLGKPAGEGESPVRES